MPTGTGLDAEALAQILELGAYIFESRRLRRNISAANPCLAWSSGLG